MCQLVGQVVIIIIICPCGSTSCPGMLSLLPSVHAPAGWPSHRHHRPSLCQLGAQVVVVAVCPCTSWLAKLSSSPVLSLIIAIIIPICPCGNPSHCRCLSCGSSSLSVASLLHHHRHRRLSLRQLPKSSPSSLPSIPWLIVGICPWFGSSSQSAPLARCHHHCRDGWWR